MKTRYKLMLCIAIGGLLGLAYYYFIGCRSGACPITGNPVVATIYGAFVGFLICSGKSSKK
ncbi:YtxH domain-containing protein [candidate division KSB1 bacterium]|nr:YtxH domain-containing protein [candidate division KSB1 bacterium]